MAGRDENARASADIMADGLVVRSDGSVAWQGGAHKNLDHMATKIETATFALG